MTALSVLAHWYYGSERQAVRIDSKVSSRSPIQREQERAGVFFSGGSTPLPHCVPINFPIQQSIRDPSRMGCWSLVLNKTALKYLSMSGNLFS